MVEWSIESVSNLPFADEKGDRICLFGISTGAYIARALAGMVFAVSCSRPILSALTSYEGGSSKIGLLGKERQEMVFTAYETYKEGNAASALGLREFISSPR